MEIPRLLLKSKGIDAGNVKFVAIGAMEDRMRAVIAGKVDATMVDTLVTTKGLENPDFHVLASIAKEFPDMAYIYLAAPEKVLKEKRKEVEVFTRYAIVDGSRFIMTVSLGLELGTLKKKVGFEEIADTSFVQKALAEAGRYAK